MKDSSSRRARHALATSIISSANLALRIALAASLLACASLVQAQAVRVTAANSSNSSIYDVLFSGSGGSIVPLNTDASTHVGLRSLTFMPNATTGQIDLLVADTQRGEILRYPNAVGVAQIVWDPTRGVANPAEGAGPLRPDGISVDAAENLFVLSSAPGNSTLAEIWVLPRNPAGPLPGGYGLPRLVDKDFGGLQVKLLEESSLARATIGSASLGDLLVLASDPATLLRYTASDLQRVLQGQGEIDPSILLATNQFPAGASPGGFDVWPTDGSLLITTGNGRILRYSAALAPLPDFASGLGNGKYKIKTGREFGVALAFVADNNGGDILKFGAPPASGPNPPLAIVTAGVQSPQGLAVSNMGAALASTCAESSGGCDALGGVLNHRVRNSQGLAGAIIEEPCVLETDPRITQFGTCTGHTLAAASVCPGFANVTIPDYLCGGSGATGAGFALIDTTTSGVGAVSDLVVNEAFSEGILTSATNPACPDTVVGWAPKPGEGSIVEGNTLLEITAACGSSWGISRGFSLWGVGLVLNEEALPGATLTEKLTNFAVTKYNALTQTIATSSIQDKVRRRLQSCIDASRSQFNRNRLTNALGELLSCDSLVAQNKSAFTSSASNPNPYGEVRGRIANLYLTIDVRMLGNPAASNWPPSP